MPPGNDRPLQTCSLDPNGRPACRSVKKMRGLPGKPPRQSRKRREAPHMQRLSWLLLAFAVPALAAAADGGVIATPSKPERGVDGPERPVGYLKTAEDKALYALGYSFGRNLQVFDLSPSELEVIRKAISEGATDKKPLIPLETYGPKIQELAAARHTRAAQKKEARDKPYLDAAAKTKGAQVLPSGVVYIAEEEGTRPAPKPTDDVTVNYAVNRSNRNE